LGAQAVAAVAEKGLSRRVVEAIATEFKALPENTQGAKEIKEKVHQSFADGKITTPEDVETKAKVFTAQAKNQEFRKAAENLPPPDVIDCIRLWALDAEDWTGRAPE
jgi:hypothetical protein